MAQFSMKITRQPGSLLGGNQQHGFDSKTKTSSSLFYLPCQADDASGNIFLDLTGDGRRVLEPRDWIQKYHKEPDVAAEPMSSANDDDRSDTTIKWSAVENARLWWRDLSHSKGTGNDNFFKLGLMLHSAGLTGAALEHALKEEAAFARSPEQRRRQIPTILARLKMQSRRRAA